MIVYHGSYQEIRMPDICHSRKRVDFGPGFYVTLILEQAVRWSQRFQRRQSYGVVTKYELEEAAFQEYKTLVFDSYSADWLDFVMACRSGETVEEYDIIQGGVANDRVFDTIQLFFDGFIDKDAAIARLRMESPNYQICIHVQEIIDRCLHFLGSEET